MDSDTDRPSESEARKEQLGAEAFECIKKHWTHWRHIATCFAVGNTKAMREAGTNRPYGRAYTHAFGKWLDAEPWRRTYDKVTRSHLLWVADHSNEIDDWRNTLAQNVRDKLNHPSTLKRHYEAAHRSQSRPSIPTRRRRKPRPRRSSPATWNWKKRTSG